MTFSTFFSTFSSISLTFSTFSSCRFSTFGHYLSLLRLLLHRELSSLYCCRCLLFVLGLLQASFLRTRLCEELRIGTLLHSPVDGRDEQLHLSHAHRALETTFSQPAMLLALRLRFLVGFILRLLVCFDLGSSLLVCFYSWPPRACRRGRGMPLPFCRTNASSSSCTSPPCPAQDPPLPPAACLCRVPAPTGPEAKRQG